MPGGKNKLAVVIRLESSVRFNPIIGSGTNEGSGAVVTGEGGAAWFLILAPLEVVVAMSANNSILLFEDDAAATDDDNGDAAIVELVSPCML